MFREMLDAKVSGTYVGLWLLIPELIRIEAWELMKFWCGTRSDCAVEPHLAMQLVNEAALCVTGLRNGRTLRQKCFENANGMGFVATDKSIHDLLDSHSCDEAAALQDALCTLRKALGHFPANIILLDPHRIPTFTRREIHPMKASPSSAPEKVMQTSFAIDAESVQPYCFTMGSPAVTTAAMTRELLKRLQPHINGPTLFIADAEHYCVEILQAFQQYPHWALLIPMHRRKETVKRCASLSYTPAWAGYAVGESSYFLPGGKEIRMIVQRTHEVPSQYQYRPFLTTSNLPGADLMNLLFPKRWNIEEFFNIQQAMGWNRASTFNLNIRFAKASLALIAQTAIYELRKKLPENIARWNSQLFAQKILGGIDGDLRVKDDTIIVTFYNAPKEYSLEKHFLNMPQRFERQGVNPRVPWLCNFKVDYRFN
jgi:hypothetical protein